MEGHTLYNALEYIYGMSIKLEQEQGGRREVIKISIQTLSENPIPLYIINN
jgi:hypothetical protein